jgi:hypothetical protein
MISAPILSRERELSLQHEQWCSFLIIEHRCGPLRVEMFSGNHCDFSNILDKRASTQSGACAEVDFSDYGTVLCSLAVEIGPRNTSISAPILPRERELSLAHGQKCSFLIMEQCCGPLAVEMVPGKRCDFSTYLAKRARAQSGACAEVQFPDFGTKLWFPGSRNLSRKTQRFQNLS